MTVQLTYVVLFMYWLREYFVFGVSTSPKIQVNLGTEKVQFMLPATLPGWVRFSVKVILPHFRSAPGKGDTHAFGLDR